MITSLLVLLVLPPPAARAADAGPEPVSYAQALDLADAHPRAAGLQRATQAKRALDARISSFVANPLVNAQAGYRFKPSFETGFEGELGVSQGFNLAGLSGLRKQGAAQEEQELEAAALAARFDARVEAALAWCSLWAAEQALQNAQEEATLAEQFAARIARAAEAAEYTQVDVSEAQAYVAEARLRVLSAEGDQFEAGVAFARALGVGPRAVQTRGALPDVPSPPHEWREVLVSKVDQLPGVVARRHAVEAERLREKELAAARGTQLQVGLLGVTDQPDQGAVALGTASVVLPAFDRGERERGVLAAEAERLSGDLAAAQAEARAVLTLALHEIDHTQEVLEQITQSALPAAERAQQLRERLLEVGEGRVLDVLLAKRAVVAMRTRLAEARALRAFAGARLSLVAQELGVETPAARRIP